jgi:LAS superfamily LD-carboxypeptidase LdcB
MEAASTQKIALMIDLESTNNTLVENTEAFLSGKNDYCQVSSAKRPHAIQAVAAKHGFEISYHQAEDDGFYYWIGVAR